MSTRARPPMQSSRNGRSRNERRVSIDEEGSTRSPSYFEWREQTVRTQAYKPEPKPQPKSSAISRLLRLFT